MERNPTESIEEPIGAMTREDLLALGERETEMFAHLENPKQKQLAESFSRVTSFLERIKFQTEIPDSGAGSEALANA